MSLSTNAVAIAVRRPKQRRRPRATLYSPPPSQTRNARAVRTRPSPGSRRSMTSPSATRSRSEEHTSELSHLGISYAVFCLKKKNIPALDDYLRQDERRASLPFLPDSRI